MNFISICSGIEAASVAFGPLGWKAIAFSEIEPFPCAVLAHHYPETPNMGDMSKFRDWPEELFAQADVIVGGPPCQAFSVAGLRNGLNDERGNLTLTYAEIINHADAVRSLYGKPPVIVLYENVPGLLSDKTGAYGCFLAALAGESFPLEPAGGRWTDAGYVLGPKRAIAWRVLDAQHFQLAQRRRRVFVVASARDGFDPASVLFEWDGMRRDSAPSREAGEGVAVGTALSVALRGREGGGTAEIGDDLQNSLRASSGGGDKPHVLAPIAFGGNNTAGSIDVATARNACASASGRMDFESETFLVQPVCVTGDITRTLKAEGFDASEDGAGRGQPIVVHGTQDPCVSEHTAFALGRNNGGENALAIAIQAGALRTNPNSGPDGVGVQLDHAYTLEARAEVQCVAVSDVVGAMSAARATEKKHGFGWGQQDWENGYCQPTPTMQVRRLTPRECERLQGFPTVSEKITIQACLDHQNQSVRVALKCLRWQNSVSYADENELTQPAKTADARSSTSPAHLAPLAALHVRMHSVDELLEIRSAGRLIWSASGAGQSRKSLPPTLTENSVQELARLLREVARTITAGKAESPPSIRLSFPASSGAINAEKSGREMEESASDAMSDQHRATFTTSDLGLITTFSDSTAETLSCFALHAIAGCIPSTTLPETFSIEMTVETPYTAIPWRKKPAGECPDGPRYKALGNSWAVPCVRWIGRRIQRQTGRIHG